MFFKETCEVRRRATFCMVTAVLVTINNTEDTYRSASFVVITKFFYVTLHPLQENEKIGHRLRKTVEISIEFLVERGHSILGKVVHDAGSADHTRVCGNCENFAENS